MGSKSGNEKYELRIFIAEVKKRLKQLPAEKAARLLPDTRRAIKQLIAQLESEDLRKDLV